MTILPVSSLPALSEADMALVVEAAYATYIGQVQSHYAVVIRENAVVSGHGRLWAARKAGLQEIPVQVLG